MREGLTKVNFIVFLAKVSATEQSRGKRHNFLFSFFFLWCLCAMSLKLRKYIAFY